MLYRGLTIHGTRGGEDQVSHSMTHHAADEREKRIDIVVVISQGMLDRLAHSLVCCEVYCPPQLPTMLLKDSIQSLLIGTVHLIEGRSTTGDLLYGIEHRGVRVREIVHDHDVIPLCQKRHSRMRADIAAAACQQDCIQIGRASCRDTV